MAAGGAILAALPLAEFGHLLSYLARYGQSGLVAQAEGVHAYFPSVLKLSFGIGGAALLAGLVLIAGARLLLGKGLGLKAERRIPVVDFFLLLASVQLAIYILQETAETIAAHVPLTISAVGLMVAWGVIGQIPVAFIAAIGLSWLSIQLKLVVAGFRSAFLRLAELGAPNWTAALHARRPAEPVLLSKRLDPRSLAKRGPPSLLQTLS